MLHVRVPVLTDAQRFHPQSHEGKPNAALPQNARNAAAGEGCVSTRDGEVTPMGFEPMSLP